MGIQDRDYMRERKFNWVTGELLKPDKNLKPLEPLKPVPINYTSTQSQARYRRTNQPPNIPLWVVLLVVVAGFCAAFWALGHWG